MKTEKSKKENGSKEYNSFNFFKKPCLAFAGILLATTFVSCANNNNGLPDGSDSTNGTDQGETGDTGGTSDTSADSNNSSDSASATDSNTESSSVQDTVTATNTSTNTSTDTDTSSTITTDTGCNDELDCPESQYCEAGTCVDDICKPEATKCDGLNILKCDPDGGAWSLLYTCGSDAYFESTCIQVTPDIAECGCEDDWDCPPNTVCNVDHCEGTGKEPTCFLKPEPFEKMLPAIEIQWGGIDQENPNAEGSPFPEAAQNVSTPLVVNLDDDNGDGLINELDFPEIIFATFKEHSFTNNGILRAIHGGGPNKGKDYFAVCGDTVWHEGDDIDMECNYNQANLDPTATMAAGDLNYDGIPEIVAAGERQNRFIAIFDNTGNLIASHEMTDIDYRNPAIVLANLDNTGPVEIIVGKIVLTLKTDDNNKLSFGDTFEGSGASGTQAQGPIPCVGNITGDSRPEIVAGTSVYRMPKPPEGITEQSQCNGSYTDPEEKAFCSGKLITVWDGASINDNINEEGFCAIADVLGSNQDEPPGPDNKLDDLPEVVLISNGHLYILNGQNGKLKTDINLNGGKKGGAPNIDDFDGDGFPEIGAALDKQYIVTDLQAPTDDCPQWPNAFNDDQTGLQGNPPREENCLHNGWRRITQDASSKVTGSSVFDFNGDGAAEVIYNDECFFRIYDGKTADVLFKQNSPSRTRTEYPIVADVDNDGNAEIVFCTSNESNFCHQNGGPADGDNYNNGIEIWGDANDMWVSARRIWNQHAYNVTNVTENARIPYKAPESWLTYNEREYNIFRSNPRTFGVAPDLTPSAIGASSPDVTCGELSTLLDITVKVKNIGDLRVGPGVVISYIGTWDNGNITEPLLADATGTKLEYTISTSIEPLGAILATVHYNSKYNGHGSVPDHIKAIVDAYDKERECVETNNEIEKEIDPGEIMADLSIKLGAIGDDCDNLTVETTVTNEGSAPASNILVNYYAGDPQAGGKLLKQATIAGPLAPGAHITITPVMSVTGTVWLYSVVDPENTIPECNDGNNIAKALKELVCDIIIR
jgi:hypothetical protein